MTEFNELYDFAHMVDAFDKTALKKYLPHFKALLMDKLVDKPHGDLERWQSAINELPDIEAEVHFKDAITLTTEQAVDSEQLQQSLMKLHPWRKGPFNFFDTEVDTEWHSDWKWNRLAPHISDLSRRRILDVGGGNGYHAWRMLDAGAGLVVNIDPSPLFFHQFQAIKQYQPQLPIFQLPMTLEQMPDQPQCFDTVFSMGVLYHRKSPLEHLEQLKFMLKMGGELVLETLIVEGDEHTLLMPKDRYAQMNNVYFLPSAKMLETMLEKMGFKNIRTVDINITSTDEQRNTDWMTWQSLPDFLDPENDQLTVEGHPRPTRAIVIANR